MSRVVSKETLHKYISMGQKSDLKIWIPITSIDTSIDSYLSSKCRAICPALVTNFSSLVSWSNLHGFNTRLEQHVSWSIKHVLDLPKYKSSAFCQRISQLHKIVTYFLKYVKHIYPKTHDCGFHMKKRRRDNDTYIWYIWYMKYL